MRSIGGGRRETRDARHETRDTRHETGDSLSVKRQASPVKRHHNVAGRGSRVFKPLPRRPSDRTGGVDARHETQDTRPETGDSLSVKRQASPVKRHHNVAGRGSSNLSQGGLATGREG